MSESLIIQFFAYSQIADERRERRGEGILSIVYMPRNYSIILLADGNEREISTSFTYGNITLSCGRARDILFSSDPSSPSGRRYG